MLKKLGVGCLGIGAAIVGAIVFFSVLHVTIGWPPEAEPVERETEAATEEQAPVEEEEPEPEPEEEEPPTLRERVVGVANEAFGYEEKPEVRLVETSEGGERVFVVYRASSNLSSRLTRLGISQDAMDFIEEMSAFDEIDEYRIVAELPLVDGYGNESVEPVAWIELDRATAEKINWENMYRDMFERLLRREGTLRFHQAIQD